MSKFIDKLTQSYRNLSPAIGFRSAAQGSENQPILLIANLTGASDTVIKGLVSSGIDAAVIGGEKVDKAVIQKLIKSTGEIPVGLLLTNADAEKVNEFVNEGVDFVIFNSSTPFSAVNREDVGKILAVNTSMEPGVIRAINALELPVEGVLIEDDGPAVTIERLLVYQFFAGLVDKPLLASASPVITSVELTGLYKAGVNGLILPVGFKGKAVSELKVTIAGLPKLAKKKSSGSALIPRISGGTKMDEDEDEDEDEDI